jgi:hypothetical protein
MTLTNPALFPLGTCTKFVRFQSALIAPVKSLATALDGQEKEGLVFQRGKLGKFARNEKIFPPAKPVDGHRSRR